MITNTRSTNSTYLTTYTKYRIYNKGNANLRGDITHEKALHVEKNAHYEPIHAVDVTKDGKYIATCSSDKTIIMKYFYNDKLEIKTYFRNLNLKQIIKLLRHPILLIRKIFKSFY